MIIGLSFNEFKVHVLRRYKLNIIYWEYCDYCHSQQLLYLLQVNNTKNNNGK